MLVRRTRYLSNVFEHGGEVFLFELTNIDHHINLIRSLRAHQQQRIKRDNLHWQSRIQSPLL